MARCRAGPGFLRTITYILALSACFVLWDCGGGKSAPAGSPTPTAAGVLKHSSRAMADVSTFQFVLASQGGDTPLPGGMALSGANGVMARPDRVDLTARARFAGFVVEVRVINVAGVTYMTNPLTGGWQRFEGNLNPLAFFDPAQGVTLVLDSVTEPAIVASEPVAGYETYHITGRLPAGAVQFISGSFVEGSVLDADLWIDRDDSLLRKVQLKGRITQGEVDGVVRNLTFSNFNEPVSIQPPM